MIKVIFLTNTIIMKKFLSIAAIALLGIAYTQAADVTALYVIGPAGTVVNGTTLPDWKMLEAVKVDLNRGKFTMDCQNISVIGVSDKSVDTEDWGNWQTGLWSLAAPLTSADLGNAVALEGPGNKNFELPWKGDWKLEFSSDLKTVTCTTTTPEPETTYYLVGDGNLGWSASDTYMFTKAEDGTYWLDVTEENKIQGVDGGNVANINIIRNGEWNAWWGCQARPIEPSENAMEWQWMTNADADSFCFAAGVSYTGSIKFVEPETMDSNSAAMVTFYPTVVEHPVSGITSIMHDEAAPVYYDLNGVRISHAHPGSICIVRQGSKVYKHIAR